jgi:hypothetical protein
MAKEQHKEQQKEEKSNKSTMSAEQIGFHKGSISVLSKEREEMLKIASICEQLLQMHVKALSDAGVDLGTVNEQTQLQKKPELPKKVPIENLI